MPDRCGDRTVTQQVVVHIDERLVHRFIDQQSAKARAVDKQVSIESATFLGSKRGDVPVAVLFSQGHLFLHVHDTRVLGGEASQEVRYQRRVEVPGVVGGLSPVQLPRRLHGVHDRGLTEARIVERLGGSTL